MDEHTLSLVIGFGGPPIILFVLLTLVKTGLGVPQKLAVAILIIALSILTGSLSHSIWGLNDLQAGTIAGIVAPIVYSLLLFLLSPSSKEAPNTHTSDSRQPPPISQENPGNTSNWMPILLAAFIQAAATIIAALLT